MSLFGDLNEVRLLGNITSDIEMRFTNSGTAVASFGVATNRRFKQGDEWKDETDFHNIVVWANLAQGLAQRAKKGTRVLITGRLQTRSWEGQDGQKKYRTEIIADDIMLIDRYERGKMEGGMGGGSNFSAPQSNDQPMSDPTPAKTSKPKAKAAPADDVVDPDDLPF